MVGADLDGVHAVRAVELRVRAADVGEQQPRRAQRPQRQLQRPADVRAERRRPDPLGDVRIAEDLGCGLEECDAEAVRKPAVLVAQLVLAPAQSGTLEQALDAVAPRLLLDVGDRETRRHPADLARLLPGVRAGLPCLLLLHTSLSTVSGACFSDKRRASEGERAPRKPRATRRRVGSRP